MRLTAIKPESKLIRKRIGSTDYEVNVYFSRTSRETMKDKVRRMIKNDANGRRAARN